VDDEHAEQILAEDLAVGDAVLWASEWVRVERVTRTARGLEIGTARGSMRVHPRDLVERRREGAGPVSGSGRGFQSLDQARRRELATKGGRAAQATGRAHRWTPEEARAAGKVGGARSHGARKGPKGAR
jgi:general stress protein YciG